MESDDSEKSNQNDNILMNIKSKHVLKKIMEYLTELNLLKLIKKIKVFKIE